MPSVEFNSILGECNANEHHADRGSAMPPSNWSKEFVSNPSPEGILSAARTAVAEFTHRQEKPQIVKLSSNRFDKMLKLDNLKNVSCHSESVDGAAVFHSVYIADHLSLISSNDEKVIRMMSSKLDTLIGSVEGKKLNDSDLTTLMNIVSSEPEWGTVHYAAACGFLGFLKTALEKDSQIVLGFATPDGDFPIHIAAKWGQVEAVRVLLEHGADLCQRDAMGRTVVHWAAANSASTLKVQHAFARNIVLRIELLFQELSTESAFSKAVTVQDEFGCSPLALAIREANFESTKILMGSAATTTTGPSPLLTVLSAMEYSEALGNCIELVITIQPSVVEQVDETGKCVLHLQLNKRVLMKVLKHSFTSVNLSLQDAEGQTPLHMAVTRDRKGGRDYCRMLPGLEYSPNLSFAVELDETDDLKLINIMWGTKEWATVSPVQCKPRKEARKGGAFADFGLK
ncbi:ankyrin repeat protein, partial [Ancylostoma ceylanicum]